MRKDVGSLLCNEESKLGFLLKDVLYVMLSCFEVKFQGGQVYRAWAGSM